MLPCRQSHRGSDLPLSAPPELRWCQPDSGMMGVGVGGRVSERMSREVGERARARTQRDARGCVLTCTGNADWM
jgi:hypothetical protein